MSGAGNTFWISDYTQFSKVPTQQQALDWTQGLCQGEHPADGLVLLFTDPDVELSWLFLNRDGSEAEMCGNAARCVGLYAKAKKLVSKDYFQFRSSAGFIGTHVLSPTEVSIELPPLKKKQHQLFLNNDDQSYEYSFVNSGVPHVVIQVDNVHPLKAHRELCRSLRKPGLFPPGGANITLIETLSKTQLIAASFERGVENFTQACGTGAIAAAVVGQFLNPEVSLIQIQMPGGCLTVDLSKENPCLLGPAVFVDEITLET